MESIRLDKVIVEGKKVTYLFTPSLGLEKYFRKDNKMFIEYDIELNDIPKSILTIPFVSIILPIIWSTNSILWIEEIDRTFYDSIKKLKNAYQELYPHFKFRGTVVSAKVIENSYEVERESIQLFSGGLDANATYVRIAETNPILVNIYGWFEKYGDISNVFEQDKKDIGEFAKQNRLNSNFIASNFATFINTSKFDDDFKQKIGRQLWYGFQHSMAFISISIPLAYKYKVRNIYIASSNTLGYRIACASDPTTDIEFKYASVGGTIHDGFELTRQDKIKIVTDYYQNKDNHFLLRVCSFNDENCCRCEKCFRTILGLVAEGVELSRFGFKIDKNLKTHFEDLMREKIHFMGLEKEKEIYWEDIKNRMIQNQEDIKETEFVEWFLTYDFIGERRKAVFKYRVKNILPILKRKVFGK